MQKPADVNGCDQVRNHVGNRRAPGGVELRACHVVEDVLEAGQLVRDGAHVAAALDVVLPAERLQAGAPLPDLAGEERDPTVVAYLHQKMHLDEPLPVRYLYWAGGVLTGDLGESVRIQKPVADLIVEKLPVTAELAVIAIVIALVIGVSAGIVSAVAKDSAWDYAANVFAL